MLGRFVLIVFISVLSTALFAGNSGPSSVSFGVLAQDDPGSINDAMEGEEQDEAVVETEDGADITDDEPEAAVTDTEKSDDEDEDDRALKPSPDADTFILFVKPTTSSELPAGSDVRFLVGFTNKANNDFIVESLEASFRYPQDYSFYIQNFTAVPLDQTVEPDKQATFEYTFSPNEAFHSRPFGLSVNLNYKDSDGNQFQNAVFNETVNIVETDEGLDGETFFLYVFLAAVLVLVLVGAQQLFTTYGKKHLLKPREPVEMGTQNKGIDYDWVPKEILEELNRSPRRSPKQSPNQRRPRRGKGSSKED